MAKVKMELLELVESTKAIFEVTDVADLGDALMKAVIERDVAKMDAFVELTGLESDHLQPIYQYYCADRTGKKQDFTPSCLAEFLSLLINDDVIVDMCAGTGALTIQKWNGNKNQKFALAEIDENVVPYLLFNMVIRNVNSEVVVGDVLADYVVKMYRITPGDKYGNVSNLESSI